MELYRGVHSSVGIGASMDMGTKDLRERPDLTLYLQF